jgi:hypothetical protein
MTLSEKTTPSVPFLSCLFRCRVNGVGGEAVRLLSEKTSSCMPPLRLFKEKTDETRKI